MNHNDIDLLAEIGKLNLVPLSDLPQEQWRGRLVLHPASQYGHAPGGDRPAGIRLAWRAEDCLFADPEDEDDRGYAFDVGIVCHFESSDWRGPAEDLSSWEVWFFGSSGSILHYGAYNLWTPKP